MSKEWPSSYFLGVDLAGSDETALVVTEVGKKVGANPETVIAFQEVVKGGMLAVQDCMSIMNQAVQGMSTHLVAVANAAAGFSEALMHDDTMMAMAMAHLAQKERERAPKPEALEWGGWPLGEPEDE